MDEIWDRKSFEVGGHWPLWRGWKHRMTTQNRQKSNAKKIANEIDELNGRCLIVLTICIKWTVRAPFAETYTSDLDSLLTWMLCQI